MKKAVWIMSCLLFFLVAVLPVGISLCACFGYRFELGSYLIFAVVTALLAAVTVLLSIGAKGGIENKGAGVLFAWLTPISLVNAVFYIAVCHEVWIALCMFVCSVCCFCLTGIHSKPLSLKISFLLLSALTVIPVGFFAFIMLFAGNMVHETIVQSLESPNGAYYAEIVSVDEGALGGSTVVNVYENKRFDIGILRIYKKPKLVYYGDWYERKNMEIYWRDNGHLVVQSAAYPIESLGNSE